MENVLVAKIEHCGNGNLIYCFDDKENYKKYDKLESKCEVCNTNRYRKFSYIVNCNGKLVQCGSDCLMKLLDMKNMSIQEEAIFNADKKLWDEDTKLLYVNGQYYNTIELLLVYIHIDHNPKNHINFDPFEWYKENKVLINEKDREIAKKVIEWYKEVEPKNEFIHNIKILISQDWVKYKQTNILKYAYQVYKDSINYEELNNTEGLTQEEFTIKKIWVEDTGVDYSYSYYGNSYVKYRMYDENNNLIEFITSSAKSFLDLINKKVKCKIKKQYNSKLGKVTLVTRIKISA